MFPLAKTAGRALDIADAAQDLAGVVEAGQQLAGAIQNPNNPNGPGVGEALLGLGAAIGAAALGAVGNARPAKGFGSPQFGNDVHSKFRKHVQSVTNTSSSDWIDRTGPGIRGIDLSLRSNAKVARRIGFTHAELKPHSISGATTFFAQLALWRAKGMTGKVKLFTYDVNGVIRAVEGTW